MAFDRKAHYRENRERILKENQAYYHANKDWLLAHQKVYRKQNCLAISDRAHDYYMRHREERLAYARAYRARKRTEKEANAE